MLEQDLYDMQNHSIEVHKFGDVKEQRPRPSQCRALAEHHLTFRVVTMSHQLSRSLQGEQLMLQGPRLTIPKTTKPLWQRVWAWFCLQELCGHPI